MAALEKWQIPDTRITKPVPQRCEVDECRNPPTHRVQHIEFSDHLTPKYACGRHVVAVMDDSIYEEGDEFFVSRIRFK